MAKCTPYPGLITGRVGGVVWQRGPAGLIVRRHSPGLHHAGNSRGNLQGPGQGGAKSAARLYLAACNAKWAALTTAQQESWIAFAFEHDPDLADGTLAGARLSYTRRSMRRMIHLQTPFTSAPTAEAIVVPRFRASSASVTLPGGTQLQIGFSPSPLVGGWRILVRIGPAVLGARVPRLARSWHGNQSPANQSSPWTATSYMPTPAGQDFWVWCAVWHLQTATVGEWQLLRVNRP